MSLCLSICCNATLKYISLDPHYPLNCQTFQTPRTYHPQLWITSWPWWPFWPTDVIQIFSLAEYKSWWQVNTPSCVKSASRKKKKKKSHLYSYTKYTGLCIWEKELEISSNQCAGFLFCLCVLFICCHTNICMLYVSWRKPALTGLAPETRINTRTK